MSFISTIEDVFATPGALQPFDMVHPVTGIGVWSNKSLTELRAEMPSIVRMPFQRWKEERARQQDTPVTWAEVSMEDYDDALDALPPAAMRGGTFLLGEPYDSHALTGRPRFWAYRIRGGKAYKASRPIQLSEFNDL